MSEPSTVAEATRRSMRANRSSETQPERRLRQALWRAGLRGYRKNVRPLPGKPDVVFGRAKLAIFLHGCYWHQCPHCTRNRTPKKNAEFWAAKFAANAARDARTEAALRELGYRVHVVWECRLGNEDAVVSEIQSLVDATREAAVADRVVLMPAVGGPSAKEDERLVAGVNGTVGVDAVDMVG